MRRVGDTEALLSALRVMMQLWIAAAAITAGQGCDERSLPQEGPFYADIEPILQQRCAECHSGEAPAAGYAVDRYLDVLACPLEAGPATEPASGEAPLLAVQGTEGHRGLLGDEELALLEAWVEQGAPARRGSAHQAGWNNPSSESFHGAVLRKERWQRLLSDEAKGACARCHALTAQVAEPAIPGATPCSSCHRDPGGPLACTTCHGDEGRAYPPRDPCFFPEEASHAGAHAAHQELECETCHGPRSIDDLALGMHGDGVVQVALDPALAGEGASWDASTHTCATRCHDRGGSLPKPPWNEAADLTCNACHQSPPPEHYAGACDRCHAEASATGDALRPGPLHINGKVDLGDGSEGCGACHGQGDDPWPGSGAHQIHRTPLRSLAVPCAECHLVPGNVFDAGHLDGDTRAELRFGVRAQARESSPRYEPGSGRCADVACHGAGLGGGDSKEPDWNAGAGQQDGDSIECGACHGAPPPAPHTSDASCASALCHGGYATPGPDVSVLGRGVHTDGKVDLWPAR